MSNSSFNDYFMKAALEEAEKAYLIGEVPVGCVIVDRGKKQVISKSHNLMQTHNNPNLHAEIIAMNEVCLIKNTKNLADFDMYVTLEPCTMCVGAIANARIGRLYYGAADLRHGAVENGVRFFSSKACFHRPEIYSSIYEKESEILMKKFFRKIRKEKE